MNSIFTRRSVRQFSEKVVETEKVEKLLRAAMQAPSAKNQQPWEFIVLKDRSKLDKLSEFKAHAQSLMSANLAIIVLGNNERMQHTNKWEQDLAAATQNICLEATELGLGTVWLGATPDTKSMDHIRDLFLLADNLIPFSVISVGYPKDENANHFVDRFDESRVTYI